LTITTRNIYIDIVARFFLFVIVLKKLLQTCSSKGGLLVGGNSKGFSKRYSVNEHKLIGLLASPLVK